MKHFLKKVVSFFVVLAVMLFSFCLPASKINVYGQGVGEPAGTAGLPETQLPVIPIMGVPGFESVPATPEDIILLNSQSESTISASVMPTLNSSKEFYAADLSDVTTVYYSVTADLKRIGAHSYIYLEQGITSVTDEMLDQIVNEFESIYANNVGFFGNPPDVDRDKKINILLMDVVDGSSGGSYVAGYYNSANELPSVNYPGISNQSEIFYMDVNEGLPDDASAMESFFGTLAHEFQHMIQYEVYLSNYTSINELEESWLNEAFSQLAIKLNNYGEPIAHIECYLSDLLRTFDAGLFEFNNNLSEYGEAYLFALYLYEKFGDTFIKNLAQNPLKGVESIDNQLVKDGINTTFDEIFEKEQIAVAIDNDDASPGDYGFTSIDISYIRLNPIYLDTDYTAFYSLSSESANYTTPIAGFPTTDGGAYRSFGALIDGTRTAGGIKLQFTSDTGDYYIVKPADNGVTVANYAAFAQVSKTIEKIKPETDESGSIVALNNDQIALLVYIAKETPIANGTLTVTEGAPASDPAPTTPAGITYTTVNAITLNWQPSTYSGGIKGYNVYRDDVKINTSLVLATSYTDFTASPDVIYEYKIEAVGMNGASEVMSEKSAPVTITAPPAADTVAPAAPTITFVSTAPSSPTPATITVYLADTNNDPAEIDHYEIISMLNGMEDGSFNGTTANLELSLAGFELNEIYNLYALSVDTAGNYSPKSNIITVKAGVGEWTDPTAPTKPTGVAAPSVGDHSITLTWNASSSASGILEYNIFRNGVFAGKTAALTFTDQNLTHNTTYNYTVEAVGNDAYNLNSELSDVFSVKTLVDTTAPTGTITYSDTDGKVKGGTSLTVYAEFSEALAGVPKITVAGAGINVSAVDMSKTDATHYTYTFNAGNGNGTATVTLGNIVDMVGYSPASTLESDFILDSDAPTASITYSAAGAVNTGTELTITANFSEDMSASPAPTIAISGASTVASTIMAMQDAKTYKYTYTVAGSNGIANVTLTGTDIAGNALGSITSGGSFTIDNTNPTVYITYSDLDKTFKNGETVGITAHFSKEIVTDPVPQITITGASTQAAIDMTRTDATTYTFNHTVNGSGNGDATVSITLAKDAAGNVVVSTPTSGASFAVDNTAPTGTITYSDTDGKVKGGTSLTVYAEFSEALAGVPKITVAGAGINVSAVDMSKTDATHYTYTFNVGNGNGTAAVTLGNIIDLAGNTPASAVGSDFILDSDAPTASISYSDSDKIVKSGDILTITADFSEDIADSPAPAPNMTIKLDGVNVVNSAAMTRSNSTSYTYSYTVGAGSGTATVSLGTGTDIAGNVVVSAPTSGASFTLDNTPPTASITYSAAGAVNTGTELTITANFSEDMSASPAPVIAISGANTASGLSMTKTDATHYYCDYEVTTGNGTATVSLGTGTDIAGNVVVSAPTSGGSFTIDSDAPTASITLSDADGIVKQGDSLTITAAFSEAMSTTAPPVITLSGAGISISNAAMSETNSTHFTYTYNVGSGNGLVTILMGGTDIAGNAVSGTLSGTTSFTIDNTAPVNITGPDRGVVTDSTVQIISKLDEDGKTYFVCLPDGASAPSNVQVKQGTTSAGEAIAANLKGTINLTANVEGNTVIKGLRGLTDYDIYAISEDTVGNMQSPVILIEATTLEDKTPPEFAATYPKVASSSVNSITVAARSNEYGKVYYVVMADNAVSPTAIEVQTGQDASGAAIGISHGSEDIAADSETSFTISGLSSSTSYDIYIIAEDASDLLQNEPVKLDATTAAPPPPSDNTPGTGGMPVPPSTSGDNIFVKPTLGSDGIATGDIGKADLDKAFAQSRSNADGNKSVTVNVQQVSGASEYAVQIPASYISSDDANRTIVVESPLGTIDIPSNMFNGNELGNAAKVGISIGLADKSGLPADIRSSIGNKPVIELSASVNGKTLNWNSDDASVKVTIDYTPTAEELKDPEHITVWYIDGSGKAVSVPNGRYDPITKKVTFTTNHFSKYAVVYVQKTFSDIADSWAKNEIEVMASKGLINGVGNNKFVPDAQITRADFITLLVRTLELKAEFAGNFNDVKTTDYYYDAVGIARKLGIANGIGNNKFNPREPISRQDMATLTFRALRIAKVINSDGIAKQPVKYNDAKQIAPYAYESVAILLENKIIERKGSEFKPGEYITRAEMADIIYNIYNN